VYGYVTHWLLINLSYTTFFYGIRMFFEKRQDVFISEPIQK
jgi:hypothetical protein